MKFLPPEHPALDVCGVLESPCGCALRSPEVRCVSSYEVVGETVSRERLDRNLADRFLDISNVQQAPNSALSATCPSRSL